MHYPSRLYVIGFLLGSLFWASPALAFISHWDPKEAFFIRQFSYLFWALAMLFFFYELKQVKLQQHRGFRLLAGASVFFALWNFDCFIGQFIALYLDTAVTSGGTKSFPSDLKMAEVSHWVYYFIKMDHLLLVPAFFLFYRGIKAFVQDPEVGKR
jgi:hypothetical protein